MAEIINITSESLQQQIRDLLPSQQGFGEDLQASNVILPIIDLTATAEGSALRSDLQIAWDFSTGHSSFINNSGTMISTPGFWLVDLTCWSSGNTGSVASITLSDGISSKTVWKFDHPSAGSDRAAISDDKFVVYLRSGDSLNGSATPDQIQLEVSYRQIADVNGNLTNPLGFTPQ